MRSLLKVFVCIPAVFAASGYAQSYSTSGDARLAVYLHEALDRNPSIKEAFDRYQAALQKLPQASALPEPMINFTNYVRSPETRVGPQTLAVSVSQQLPWFGKLSDREKVAAKEAAALAEMYETQQDEIIRQVKIAYYTLAYMDQAIGITEQDRDLLQHYETLAQARYAQGVGLQQSAVKLQADITRSLSRLEELRMRRVDAEAVLNELMDRPQQTPIETIPAVSVPDIQIDLPGLYESGRQNRPELRLALLQIERDEGRIHLAERGRLPDFTVGVGYVNVDKRSDPAGILNPPSQNGKNIFSFSFGVAVPIRDRKYDAAVLEATEAVAGSREGFRGIQNAMEAAIRSTGFRISTLSQQIHLFEHTLLPQAEQVLNSSEAAYTTGTLGVLDLLDSQRVLLEVRLGLAQLSTDYMKAMAEMERAVGAPFPEGKK
jgi:outer membrane protein, heavy metal efflux system